MKQLLFVISIAFIALTISCNKGTTLPPYSAPTIFSAATKMTHAKDTIKSTGDTVFLITQGNINDTSRHYTISVSLKATDASSNLISGEFIKSVTAAFDTTGLAKSGLFHWTAVLAFPIPAVPTKTVLTSTATFSYGLSLSSETGNQVSTESKSTYAK